ncbi:MAG: sulfatase, partial [Phycisphaerales bacterium]
IVHYLKDLGYRVGLTGKKHFGPPESFPFEFLTGRGHDDGKGKDLRFDAARAFMRRDRNEPYCLLVTSNQPHGPWNRGEASAYDAEKLTVPPHLVDCPETRHDMTKYYAEITYLDGQLGQCLDIVDRSGQRDNTIVIFTSEQGASFPSGGKWTCYDTGLKTAFIVRWPERIKAGTRTDAMTQYVDVVPTLIEAIGGEPENIETGRPDAHGDKGFDGRSFLSVLLGRTDEHRDFVYGVHTTRGIIRGSACYPIRSIRSSRFKYIWNPNHEAPFYNVVSTGPKSMFEVWARYGQDEPHAAFLTHRYRHRPAEELYDVQEDPFELNNLAAKGEYAKIKAELRAELLAWMQQQGDEGINTELKALERQGPNREWTPYSPYRSPA